MKASLNRLAFELKNFFSPPPFNPVDDTRENSRFIDVQRQLRIYLRALWDCDFVLKQASVDSLGNDVNRPFIEYYLINLPEVFYDCQLGGESVTGSEIYRASATHAAAHLIYAGNHFSSRSLDKWQIAMISLIEDARVEALAIRQFPGLKPLWASQHTVTPEDKQTAGHYLNRLARALLDEDYQDEDSWVNQGRQLFNPIKDLDDELLSKNLGLILAESFRQKKIPFKNSTDTQSALYRDNNSFLWKRGGPPLELFSPYSKAQATAEIEEGTNQSKPRTLPDPEQVTKGKPVVETFSYPEWNYRSKVDDQAWVTLREQVPVSGEVQFANEIATENRHLIARMKNLLRAIRDGAPHRSRKLEDGDEIDINAAIRARIDQRLGVPPDTRIMMRSKRKTRDISVLMLVDLSRSMNDLLPDSEQTAMQVTQQACVLFAEAMQSVGDPFAIHGFHSYTRHFVEYFCFKDFAQAYDEGPKAAIAGMKGQCGTRMGAAIRHATTHLNQQKSNKKILLIMTDGEPHDVDTPDPKYLRDDTKKSVEEAKRMGIHTYCISLDPSADKYVSRIFGAMNYMVVDHIKHLPEKVLLIYAGLAR